MLRYGKHLIVRVKNLNLNMLFALSFNYCIIIMLRKKFMNYITKNEFLKVLSKANINLCA